VLFRSNAALSFYGYSKEEIGSMNIDQINTITLQEVSKTVRKNSPTPDFHCVFKHRLKNGSIRDVETFSIPITINDQHYVYSIILDITDRLEAEKQIAENEEFLNNMFNTIQDGILVTDLDFNVLAANPTIYKWYSLDESIVGKKCYDVLKTEGKSCSVCPVRNAIKTGSLRKERLELIMKDGKTYHRENYAYPMRNGKGEIASIMQYIRDVSDIRKMEVELLKMEKLDSLSTLAAGIAHDFNNLLNGLFGYIEMAKIYYLNPEKVNSYLASALSTFERAKGLTQQLSTFASGSPLEKKIISVKDLLYSTVNFALSGSNVRAIYEIEEDLWNCNIDKNQIGQVIDNIVINARQAMPNGGIINVAAQNVPPEEEHEWRKEGENYVKVTITDTGKGIPEHLLKKIFDPFFTTKQKGSGLGLATSYSIINKHKGRIEASSTLGIGTTFTIYFPTSFEEING
jgi:PAS domain S-box-containing protein